MNDSLGVLLKKTILEFDKRYNHLLVPYDLTHSQHSVLMLLYNNPPLSIRQTDIEKYFSMTNPTVTGILQNMERKGLICRMQNPADKRSKVIALTPKAKQMREEMYDCSYRIDSLVSQNLEEEEVTEIVTLLKKLVGPVKTRDVIQNVPIKFYPEEPSFEKIQQIETTICPILHQNAPFEVSALRKSFDDDLEGALAVYRDKRFVVTGVVINIGSNIHHKYFIELSDRVGGACHTICGVADESCYKGISVGDRVTVRANYLSHSNWFGLMLRNSEVLSVEKCHP